MTAPNMLRVDLAITGSSARVIFCEVTAGGAIAGDLRALPGDGSELVDEAGACLSAFDLEVDASPDATLASCFSVLGAAIFRSREPGAQRMEVRKALARGLVALLQLAARGGR